MMKLFTAFAAAMVVAATASVSAQPAPSNRPSTVTDSASSTGTAARDKATTKSLANSICPVSKQGVGSMGPGTKVQHKGYEFSLCCSGCLVEFNKKPDAYLEAALNSGKAKPAAPNQSPQ